MLPNHVISHSIKPSYFKEDSKGYNLVHKQVGDTIDFYNIFYIQEADSQYDEYEEIFGRGSANPDGSSKSISIQNLIDSGIPSYKLVVAKTISKSDLYNGGWVQPSDLG